MTLGTAQIFESAPPLSLSAWDALARATSSADGNSPHASVWETLAHTLSLSEERPQIVAGVESAQQTTRAGAAYVVIRNPAANMYLKLDPTEFELTRLMDGARTIRELVIAYYQQNGVLAMSRIVDLVRLLQKSHFLTAPAEDAYTMLGKAAHGRDASGAWRRAFNAFMHTEFPLRNIDARLSKWYRAWAWIFFSRVGVLLQLALIASGAALFLLELNRNRYDLFQVNNSYTLGIVLLFVFEMIILIIHEMGHAFAVKFAGRYVPHGGLMLYFGMLCGYVDTSDVWMAERRKRIIAALAGPWTGLVFGGIFGVLVFVLPQSAFGSVLFGWAFVFLVGTLFNFNPLLELDGYYILVDLIEKPMLRQRSLAFVRGPLWKKLWRRERLTGEEIFFALFGLAALGYSVMVLFFALNVWQRRVAGFLGEAWTSGNLLLQLATVATVGVIATSLLMSLWAMARRIAASATERLAQLNKHVQARRHQQAMDALRAIPLWKNLPSAQLLQIARAMRAEQIEPGAEVVRQGEPGDRFYLVAHGAFEVLVDGQPVRRVGRGDYFGERALLTNAPRNATVVAMEPSRVFSLDQTTFHATLAHDLALHARLQAALDYRADVAAIPLFRDLSSAELDLLLTRLTPVSAAPGQAIFQQGEPGDRFYVIRSGQVEVVRDGEQIATRGKGEAFGEIALLNNVPRTATVRAIAPTEMLALNASDLRDLLGAYLGRAGELQQMSHQRLQTYRHLDTAT